VPGPGDPDGTGSFVARVNPGTGQLCYVVTVSGVDDVIAAHVHSVTLPAGAVRGQLG